MGNALVPGTRPRQPSCPRPSSLSTTDNDDDANAAKSNNTNDDGETLCASPGVQSRSVVDPAPQAHLLGCSDETLVDPCGSRRPRWC